jgi:hypothetical protein
MLVYLFSNFSISAIHKNMEICKSHPKITNKKIKNKIKNWQQQQQHRR